MIVDYYSDDYHKERHPEFINSKEISKAWSEFAYIEYFKNKQFKNVLEFGGGLGQNLIYLANFHDAWMIEPSELGRNFANFFNINTAASISDLRSFNSEKFDVILCRHVLEHLENPMQTLIELKSLLRPDGKLILVLPVENQKKPVINEIDFHLYCWTPRTAINLLNLANYQIIEWRYNKFTGKRIFFPIYKMFGITYYRLFMKIAGSILNAKELLIVCK